MNNRLVLIIAVILAFATGFISSQMLVVKEVPSPNIIYANGTKIMVVNDGDYYPLILKELNKANSSIHMIMYEMVWYGNPENDTHDVSRLGLALVKARERGLEVKLILEDGKSHGYTNSPLRGWNENWSRYLRSKGIEVRFDGSSQTTHDKLVIIDHRIVIVGSTNWSDSALNYNHEANVLIQGREVAEEYEEYFETLWQQSS